MNSAAQFDTLPECAETQRGLVAVAMSGGVDSSAVAGLLLQEGRAVVLTSNLTGDQLMTVLSDRAVDRLADWGDVHEVRGRSMRGRSAARLASA